MALGKIKADTLEHSTAGSVDTQFMVKGSAKAWCFFEGDGTVSLLNSLNHASISDLGTGQYSVTYTTSFSSIQYAANVTGSTSRSGTNDTDTNATGGITYEFFYATSTKADPAQAYCAIHGDLA